MDLTTTVIVLVLTTIIGAGPTVGAPIGMIVAAWCLGSGTSIPDGALIGTAGLALGRCLIALSTWRRVAASTAPNDPIRTIGTWLRSHPSSRKAAFSAGTLPVVPGPALFRAVGTIGINPFWPALGTFIGRLPIVILSTWLFSSIARWFTTTDAQAARSLAFATIGIVVFRAVTTFDWGTSRTERRPRFRDHSSAGGRFGQFPGGAPWGHVEPGQEDDEDVIEGEVVGEEPDDSSPNGHPGGRMDSLPPG